MDANTIDKTVAHMNIGSAQVVGERSHIGAI